MNTPSDLIIISPHPDDAIFSLGQHIFNWQNIGHSITIYNVFDQYGHEDLSSENAWNFILKYGYQNVHQLSLARKNDNQKIARELAVDYVSLKYTDASFRQFGGNPVYQTAQSLNNGRPSTFDRDLPSQIASQLKVEKSNTIYCPYGVGNHADHVLMKLLGQLLQKQKYQVNYYLESPYIWRDFNYLKYSIPILQATSYLKDVSDKMRLLQTYSYSQQIVRSGETFPEIIL
jgi:LmbE family N-acetylglucosaminyl deacetylase